MSYWVIPDTRGVLKGLLHVLRRFEYCRDVIILVSERTGADYVAYLDERDYDRDRLRPRTARITAGPSASWPSDTG